MSVLGDKLRCPHCLEELDNLEDPKQLPCTHVFCSPCLEILTKTEEGKVEITCSICSKSHQVDNLAALPTPTNETCTSEQDTDGTINIDASTDDKGEGKPGKRCDRCKEETTAVCHCVECNKSLCPRHEQLHQDFFGDGEDADHKLISIQNYMLKPRFYMKPKCDQHKKEYIVSCNKCFCLRCKDCAEGGKCVENNDHSYKTMNDIRSQLEAEFAELTKSVTDKMTEMCKLEKETWQKLDNLEMECDELRQDIQDKTKDMIRVINEQKDKVLARIDSYANDKKIQVEAKLQKLRTQKEDMEGLRHESQLMIRNSHVTEIIEQRIAMVGQLKEAAEVNIKEWDHLDLLLLKESLKIFSRGSMNLVPSTVESISTQHTGGPCYSTWFGDDGELLVGCHDGLRGYSQYGDGYKQLSKIPHVTSVSEWHSDSPQGANLCMMAFDGGDIRTVYGLHKLHNIPTSLFSYPDSTNDALFLVTSKKYAVVATAEKSHIIIYDTNKKTQGSVKLQTAASQLSFLSDDFLIATNSSSHTIQMYYIEHINKLNLVWKCTGLQGVSGVCTTECGLIVCTSKTKKVIYIVSAQGKLLNTLHNERIQPGVGQISIHGDILAVPCPEQKMFQMIRLKYKWTGFNLYQMLHWT